MVVLCVSCMGAPCQAAWHLITRTDDGLMTFYADPKSMSRHGHKVRVRLLFDYAQVQQDPDTLVEHRSTIELASVDCSGRSIAPVQATSYERPMARGRVVARDERVPEASLRFIKAAPASIDDKVVTFACRSRRQ